MRSWAALVDCATSRRETQTTFGQRTDAVLAGRAPLMTITF
jgi:hypothetical protein